MAGSLARPVDHDFTQGLQHLPLVVLKVPVDLAHALLLHHPQLAVGFCDEAGIVADDNHSYREKVELEQEWRENPAEGRHNLVPEGRPGLGVRGNAPSRLTTLVLIDGLAQSINRLYVQVIGGLILQRRKHTTEPWLVFAAAATSVLPQRLRLLTKMRTSGSRQASSANTTRAFCPPAAKRSPSHLLPGTEATLPAGVCAVGVDDMKM